MATTQTPRFGVSLFPSAETLAQQLRIAEMADRAGIEYIGAQDHPYNAEFTDTWSLLTYIAARTQHVHILPNVLNMPLRPAPMLAKSAATIDVMTGGRVELGIGAGAFAQGTYSMGGPNRSAGESVDALGEAIEVMKNFWLGAETGRTLNFPGKYYQLRNVQAGPAPAHQIGVWVGSYAPRMLRLTGRLADGWLPSSGYLPAERVLAAQALIDEGASKAGRAASAIRRGYNVMGMILPEGYGARGQRPGILMGTAQQWVDELTRYYYDLRLDTFIFWPSNDEEGQTRRFIEEVVPALRDKLK
jgi:alkanesulfonate monooxygenase SsuD/methylene tetrahydromethanopterin reductase-like flavin-dependent oxidoreductase (luciferase family)